MRETLEYIVVGLSFVWSFALSHWNDDLKKWKEPAFFILILIALFIRQRTFKKTNSGRRDADCGLWMILCFPFAVWTAGNFVQHERHVWLIEMFTTQTLTLSLTTVYSSSSSFLLLTTVISMASNVKFLPSYPIWTVCAASIFCSLIFFYSSSKFKRLAARSFTDGERLTVVQAISVFVTFSLLSIILELSVPKSAAFLQGIVLSLFVLLSIYCQCEWSRKSSLSFWITFAVTTAFVFYPVTRLSLRDEPVSFLFSFLTKSGQRISLFGFWFGLSLAAGLFTVYAFEVMSSTKTAIRKVFHLFIVVVFTSGACFDPELVYVCTVFVLVILVLFETIRVLRIEPIGPQLDAIIAPIIDEKDQGEIILSQLYLLIGCALSFFLYTGRDFDREGNTLALLTGVITLGVGDTCAAIFGVRYGRTRWPGTKKTIEGTIAAIVCQLAFCLLFAPATADVLFVGKLLILLVLTSCLEASTVQNDNLAVPLLGFPLFLSLVQ